MRLETLRPARGATAAALALLLLLLGTLPATAITFGPVDLGAGSDLTVFALSGQFSLSNSQTTVDGNIALGPGGKQNFSDATILDTYFVDSSADNGKSNNVTFSGGTQIVNLGQAVTDVHDAAVIAGALTATQVLGDIQSSLSVAGTGGLNVIDAGKIKLSGSAKLTLAGSAADIFIINASDLNLSGTSQVALAGGVTASNVLFNLSNEYVQSGDSLVNGSVLCVSSGGCTKEARNNGAFLNGSLFAEAVTLTSGTRVNSVPGSSVPEPSAALVFFAGSLMVGAAGRRGRSR